MALVDKETFFKLTDKFNEIPFTQSYGWYTMHSLHHPEKIIFLVNSINNPTIACFGHIKKMGFIKMLLIEDERYLDENSTNPSLIREFYMDVISLGFDIVETCSNKLFCFDYEIGMRQAGFLRPVGQFCFPSTKIIDLTKPIVYNRNWRRNLKKATESNLHFEIIDQATQNDVDDFLEIYSSMSSRKKVHFNYNSKQIYSLCTSSENIRLFFVSANRKRQACFIVYTSNDNAYPLYVASDSNALNTAASNFIYNELFKYLIKCGVKKFDMAKLLPSSDKMNNVFLFKNGIDGTFIQLNGEWGWYKHSIYRIGMYFVKKHLLNKREM